MNPRTMITRGTLRAARIVGGRVLADVTLFAGEVRSRVELWLPPGVTTLPAPGTEVLAFAVGGARDHLVAIADSPATRFIGAATGEIALRDAAGQQVALRADGVEITGALKVTIVSSGPVVIAAPSVKLGSASATQPVRLANGAAATKVFAE